MKFIVLETVDSTNNYLQRLISSGANFPCGVLAYQQTNGRGRGGKSWCSDLNQGLYLSYTQNFSLPVSSLSCCSLALGVSTVNTLETFFPSLRENIKLKWPNDLYIADAKLAGILCETMQGWVIVGLGLNYIKPNAPTLVSITTSLDEVGINNFDQVALANQLIIGWQEAIKRYESDGFSPFEMQWQQYDYLLNRNVKVFQNSLTEIGVMRGISSTGAVKIELKSGIKHFYFGEISLRAENK